MLRVCSVSGCPNLTDQGRCSVCRKRARKSSDANRPSAAARGYDRHWRSRRRRFLRDYPFCVDCGAEATVADHAPVSRAELVRRGDPDPDDERHLQSRCKACHDSRTAHEQPGGWHTAR